MTQHVDMNGLWSGVYSYALIGNPVKFTAWIDDQAGLLGGTITEPNTFVEKGPDELTAIIKGARTGRMMDFAKSYETSTGAHNEEIYYEGEINPAFTEVTGTWQLRSRNTLTGQFTLTRMSGGLAKAVTRKAFADLDP